MIKIIPTIGPISSSSKDLVFLSKFSNIFRLNTSHNNISWHVQILQKIKKLKKNIKVLVDIPGVKPRTNNKENIFVKKNSIIIFYYNKIKKKKK